MNIGNVKITYTKRAGAACHEVRADGRLIGTTIRRDDGWHADSSVVERSCIEDSRDNSAVVLLYYAEAA